MYSTLKNISNKKPTINSNAVCSRYLQYPDETGEREAEGGLRLEGKYKQSLQDKPLITVITVVYNNEETLERCIKSVLEQTYDNIEYIVIDGGSSDETLDIIKKYQDSIDYFISEPDEGIYYAMNKGISLASGDYLNFMNSDDWFRENFTISSIIKSTVLDLNTVYYGQIMYTKEGKEYRESWEQMVDENILVGYPIPHQSAFVGRNAFNTLGIFDTKYKISADFEWWVRAKINKISFYNMQCIVANYSIGGISSSDDGWDLGQIEYMYILLINKLIEPEDLLSPRLKFFDPFKNIDKSSIRQNLAHIKMSKEDTALIEKSLAPIISIIIPVYNMEKYIKDCLDSLIAQSIFNRLEVICVDDASRDTSVEIINQYIDRYSAITLIKHNTNLGALAARYTGIQQAQGKYFIFLDSDDFMPIDACEVLYREAKIKNADIVMGKAIWKFNENYELPKKEQITMSYLETWHIQAPSKNFRFNATTPLLPLWSKIYKASLVNESLDYSLPNISHGEDICFFLNIFLKSKTFFVTDKIVYWRRARNNSSISETSINVVVQRVLSFLHMIQQTRVFYLTELEQKIIRSQISYIKEISEKIEDSKEKNDAFNIIENLQVALNGDLLKFYNNLKETYSIKTLGDVLNITHACSKLEQKDNNLLSTFGETTSKTIHTLSYYNNCVAYDKDWQFPAITEQHAFIMLRNNQSVSKNNSIYVAFPWATLIDLLNNCKDRSRILQDMLTQIKKKITGKKNIITVCQHISMLKYQNIFIEMGITDIFWTHAIKGQDTLPKSQRVNIYPFPLYPVHHDNEHNLNTEREHLYSFVGARAAKYYLTQSRNFIIDNLSKDTRGLVIGREGWHYENVVYNHQIKQEAVSNSNLVDNASSVEFQDIVKNSIFSLCPSGSGPNSIRLWESIGFGTIPVILADTYLPPGDSELWKEAVVYCKETEAAIQKLPELLEELAKNESLLAKKRAAMKKLWMMYGTENFVNDVHHLLSLDANIEETWRKDQLLQQKEHQLQLKDIQLKQKDTQLKQKDTQLKQKDTQLKQKDTQLKQKDTQLKQKDTQLKKLNSKTNTLKNNKWYRFGKLSRKKKIWTSGKVLSKKMKIHWALKPFAQVVKKGIKK